MTAQATVSLIQVSGASVTTEQELDAIVRERKSRADRIRQEFNALGLADAAETIDGAIVAWSGPTLLVPLVCLALLDKLLSNLRPRMSNEGYALLSRVSQLVDGPSTKANPWPFAEVIPLVGLPVDDYAGFAPPVPRGLCEAYDAGAIVAPGGVRCDIVYMPFKHRLMAGLHFTPRRAMNERLAELGYWAVYDRMTAALMRQNADQNENAEPSETVVALGPHLRALGDLAATYQNRGLPKIRDLGKAPYEAAARSGLLPAVSELVE